jgi:hypothetical protein
VIGIKLDTGALIALERRGQRMKEIVERALAKDQPLTVPADVIGEWWSMYASGDRAHRDRLIVNIERFAAHRRQGSVVTRGVEQAPARRTPTLPMGISWLRDSARRRLPASLAVMSGRTGLLES